jgi:hypothetical protein
MAPELVEEFIQAFQKEINLQRREHDGLRDAKMRELAGVKRKLDGLIEAIADGLRAPGLQQRLDELEARRTDIEQSLIAGPATPVASIRIWHRSIGARWSGFSMPSVSQKFGTRPCRSSED